MISPAIGIVSVLAVMGGLLGGLGMYRRRYAPHPELVRKLLHMGMGLVTLTFPWVFDSAWPVILLAVLSLVAMVALKSGRFRAGPGQVLHGVARESQGEMYFVASVTLLFVLAHKTPLLFVVPVLILTFADATAALIGVRYGLARYQSVEGEKSAEGSIAFFTVAFLATHIPVLLSGDTGREEAVLIGLTLGVLVMLLEAIAWRGLDNLLIPLGGYLLLKTYLTMPAAELWPRLVATLALVGFALYWRRRTTLNDSAALAAAFIGYLSWAVGGWPWLVPMVILFVAYPLVSPRSAADEHRVHDARAVLAIGASGIWWLFVASVTERTELYYVYTLAFAAQLGMIALARLLYQFPQWPRNRVIASAVIYGWLILFVPWVVLAWAGPTSLVYLLFAGVVVAAAVVAFYRLQPGVADCPTDRPRWLRQGAIAFTASLAGFIPLYRV